MTNYVCVECGFRVESEDRPKACPYCSGNKLDKERTAEELIDNLDIE